MLFRMSKFQLFVTFLLIGISTSAFAQSGNWTVTWSDEFDGPAMSLPDPSKWAYDAGAGGWGNNEEETYCSAKSDKAPCSASKPNAYLDGSGHLVIQAIRSGSSWTSARLKTSGKQDFEYGRIEASMKLPRGAGVWPAFWMLGSNISKVGWPQSGEIDIMENVPQLGVRRIASTIHGPVSTGKGIGEQFVFPGQDAIDSGFHTYGVIWSPGETSFYVDDFTKPFFTTTKSSAPAGEWVYDHPFFLLLNLAMGGNWPGHSDSTTPNPAVMQVDYVRVYKAATAK
jgi:beta-glucanase (GH16 family)